MKKKIAIILSCVLVLTCMLYGPVVHANRDQSNMITKPYDYPIKPGTQEWIALPSVIERREACEIPQEILERMTTSALVESVITYPFFIDTIGAFNSFEEGLNWVATYFSGIDELLSRSDACVCLRDYLLREKDQYELLSAMDVSDKTVEQMRQCSQYRSAELLLGYMESLD
ncbi:MAG: hypothetical protein K5678_05530 [Acetatifactor sp.]|nr:hypothetical protein [Acetatifactor sp.]